MSEKFSLKWNDYNSKWNSSLSKLRGNNAFADVTLTSDDKVKFSAHRILLSSCSNVFNFILEDSNQANPLLYLGGISSTNLGFILDYIYNGEVNLYQEQLDGFLESAQKLEIEGLLDVNQEYEKDLNIRPDTNHKMNIEQYNEKQFLDEIEENQLMNIDNSGPLKRRRQIPSNDVAKFDVRSMNPEQLQRKIKELYQKVDGVWGCLACNYTSALNSSNIIRHIHKIHLKKSSLMSSSS